MFERRLAGVVMAAALLAAGAVHATESVFPRSENETALTDMHVGQLPAITGAVFPSNFPTSANETGPSDVRRAEIAANVGATAGAAARGSTRWHIPRGVTSALPSSSNETGPRW